MGTLANSEEPDEMPQHAAFHQDLHPLLIYNKFPGIEIHLNQLTVICTTHVECLLFRMKLMVH